MVLSPSRTLLCSCVSCFVKWCWALCSVLFEKIIIIWRRSGGELRSFAVVRQKFASRGMKSIFHQVGNISREHEQITCSLWWTCVYYMCMLVAFVFEFRLPRLALREIIFFINMFWLDLDLGTNIPRNKYTQFGLSYIHNPSRLGEQQ